MQHQLLFFDIDGTLLSNATHQIPESALSAIAAAQKNGHLVFINTGRTIRTMPSFLKTLGFDGYLCGCGTRIVYHDEILLAHSFTEEEGQLLIDLMDKWHIEAFLEGSEDVYCKRGTYRQRIMNQVRKSFNDEGLGLSCFIEDRNFIYDKFVLVSDNQADSDAFIHEIESFIDVIDRGKGMYAFPRDSPKLLLCIYWPNIWISPWTTHGPSVTAATICRCSKLQHTASLWVNIHRFLNHSLR